MDLLILGAGGHGRVVKEVAEATGKYNRIDFVDDHSDIAVGKISDLEWLHENYASAFVGIGNNQLRNELIIKLESIGYAVPVLIHPTAYVSKSCHIEKGTIIELMTVVNANAKVGMGCIISVGAVLDHDIVVGDCVHINAGAIVKDGDKVESGIKVDASEVWPVCHEMTSKSVVERAVKLADSNSDFAKAHREATMKDVSSFLY